MIMLCSRQIPTSKNHIKTDIVYIQEIRTPAARRKKEVAPKKGARWSIEKKQWRLKSNNTKRNSMVQS